MKFLKFNQQITRISIVICMVFLVILIAGASADSQEIVKNEITLVDMLDRTVTLSVPVERIVLGSSRDIHEISALEGDQFLKRIVGWGPDIKDTDKDTYMKILELYPEAESIPDVGSWNKGTFSAENVVSLNPDVVIIPYWEKDKCMDDVQKLEAAGIPVVFTDFWKEPLQNPPKSMRILGQLLGKEDRAEEIAGYFEDKVAYIKDTIQKESLSKPRVYVECGWKGPSEYGNTYGKAGWGILVDAAGGDNIGEITDMSTVTPEYLLSQNPEKIVISGANWPDAVNSLRLGYYATPEQAKSLLSGYTTREGWNNIDAVKNNEVYGPFHGFCFRIYNFIALEALAKWFHPEIFSEFDPEGELMQFHEKFMPFEYSGTWFTSLKE